jgi:hypothetical protein
MTHGYLTFFFMEAFMKATKSSIWGLVLMLLMALWSVGQAQDSLGMSRVATLDYWSDDMRIR